MHESCRTKIFLDFQVSFLIWGSKNVQLTLWFFYLQIPSSPHFSTEDDPYGHHWCRIPYTPYKKERLASWYLTGRDLRKDVFLFLCHPFWGSKSMQSFDLVLGGFRSINSRTASDLDHQHRTFSFLFLRSQGLTKSRVLEWKGPTYVPLDMNLTYYLIDMKYLSIFWKTGFKQNWQQTCSHLILHINLIPIVPPSLKTWSPPPGHFPHLRHVLLMLLSLHKAE